MVWRPCDKDERIRYDDNYPESALGRRCLNVITGTECSPGYCSFGVYWKNQVLAWLFGSVPMEDVVVSVVKAAVYDNTPFIERRDHLIILLEG